MYFIAIVLPQNINEKVLKYKNKMLEKYNCKEGLKSPSHITLVPPFWMEDEKEDQLIADINSVSSYLHPFNISTDNFSTFQPRTIFIALAPDEHLNEVRKVADAIFKGNSVYNIKIDTKLFHPHITSATRDLAKKNFHEIWPWFAEKKFLEEWTVGGISILRHNKKNWDVIYTSQFSTI
jgi:2'-5' RNA ligase